MPAATLRLPVRLRPDLPRGVAGLSAGTASCGGNHPAGLGKDREAEMTSPYPILSILGIIVVALTIAA